MERWNSHVFSRPTEIDPERGCDWFDLAYGFFLGSGEGPENAYYLANEALTRGLL